MNYKGWGRRRPMKGPRRKPSGIIASGAQRADPEFWKEKAEAEAEHEGLQGTVRTAFPAIENWPCGDLVDQRESSTVLH